MSALIAAQRVAIARHPQRPNITDYIGALFTDFFECRGDRLCMEDPAILGGVALYHGRPVTVISTRKGKTLEELTLDELKAVSDLFDQDVYEAINLENCMALRSSYGGPAVSETTRQIEAIEDFVKAHTK